MLFGRSLGILERKKKKKEEEEQGEGTAKRKKRLRNPWGISSSSSPSSSSSSEADPPERTRERLTRGTRAVYAHLRHWVLGPGNWQVSPHYWAWYG